MSILRKPLIVEKMYKFYKTFLKNGGEIGAQSRVVDFTYNNSAHEASCVRLKDQHQNLSVILGS